MAATGTGLDIPGMTWRGRRVARSWAGLAALATLAAVASPVLAVDSPNGDQAAAWPTTWRAYLLADGSTVRDVISDVGCGAGYCDVSSGSGASPSVYFGSNGQAVFFRLRMLADPRNPSAAGFHSTTWAVQIAVDGVARATVGLNGKSPQRDFVYVANADGSQYTEIYATPFTNSGGESSFGARGMPDGGGQYYLDFQVPLWRITQRSGGLITGSTPVQLFFGTSQAANLAVLNKDFMIGNAVNFGPTSEVTLVPPPAAQPGDPIVPEIPNTSALDPTSRNPSMPAATLLIGALVVVGTLLAARRPALD
jgi:hypothetical protein